jgi:hypothetical protein
VGGLSPVEHDLASLHGLQASWQYSFPHLFIRKFFPTKLLFLHVSCIFGLFLLEIWQFWGKEIPQMPLAKFAHDFVLRPWFKKIAKNKIKFHRTGGSVLFLK